MIKFKFSITSPYRITVRYPWILLTLKKFFLEPGHDKISVRLRFNTSASAGCRDNKYFQKFVLLSYNFPRTTPTHMNTSVIIYQ